MTPRESEALLFFLHIPKAGGSTLSKIIRQQYPESQVLDSYPGTFREKIAAKNALESARWRHNYFAQLPQETKRNTRAFMGHEGFGFHEAFAQPAAYITMLREPVDRILSHYYYVRQSRNNRLHKTVVNHQMSLDEFVSSGISNEVDNSQTKFLAGMETPYLKAGEYGEELLRAAQQNLKNHFILVGLTECFDESLILLKRLMGWHWPFYVPANVTRKRPQRQEVSPETAALIKDKNKLDIALYEFARQRFEANLQAQDTSFHRELEKFRRLNKLYALWHYSLSTMRSRIRSLRPAL